MLTLTVAVLIAAQDPDRIAALLDGDAAVRGRALAQAGPELLPALRDRRTATTDTAIRQRLDDAIAVIELAHPGRLLVAFTRGERFTGEIWLHEDGKERRLTTNDAMEATPALSPDGRRLAYAQTREKDGSRWDAYEVIVQDLATGQPVSLGPGRSPRWSPAGDRVAIGTGNAMAIVDRDGGNRREVIDLGGPVYALTWSDDGKRLATEVDNAIVVVDADGGKVLHRIDGTPPGTSSLYNFAWNADGSCVSFVAGNGPYHWDVWIAEGGAEARKLGQKTFQHGISALSPDGRTVACCLSWHDHQAFSLLDVATGDERVVHDSVSALLQPTWSPDGRYVVFVDDGQQIRLLHVPSGRSRILAKMDELYGPAAIWFAPSARFLGR